MSATQETVLMVEGMSCASCVRHVEGALRRLPGVGAVRVELEAKRVLVEHDPGGAPLSRMIAALGDEGYEAREASP